MLPDALPQRAQHGVEGLDAVRVGRLRARSQRQGGDGAALLVLVCEAVGDDVDEADLESELAALEDEFDMDAVGEEDAMPAYLQPAAPAPAMPVAPSSDPVPAMGQPAAAVDKYGLPVGPTSAT